MPKVILLALLLGACSTVSTKLVSRMPDASVMQPCQKPAPLPAKPTGSDIDRALVTTTQLLLECSAKHDGLIQFEQAAPK
jgi:hypothetical protein